MKKIFFILFLSCIVCYAEMPTIIGVGIFSDKTYRDNIYNYLVGKSSNCINRLVIKKEDYEIDLGTGTAYYIIKIQMHYLLSKLTDRKEVKQKILNIKNDNRTIGLEIGIYESNNDGVPGLCKPDRIKQWIKK